MVDMFKEIHKKETNENTALIMMLGRLGEKLTDIDILIRKSNKLSEEIIACLKTQEKEFKKEIIIIEPLRKEDYME